MPLTNWELLRRVVAELDLPSNIFVPKSIQASPQPAHLCNVARSIQPHTERPRPHSATLPKRTATNAKRDIAHDVEGRCDVVAAEQSSHCCVVTAQPGTVLIEPRRMREVNERSTAV